ncbi:hypothetical protein MRB53_042195 [Persea americana]|nr:hypothetical protein MRB53_042195 [Persea americana]
MTIYTLACGKASAFVPVELSSASMSAANTSFRRCYTHRHHIGSTSPQHHRYHAATEPRRHASSLNTDAADQRDLFVDILSANATKRDAKQFLARFKGSDSKQKTTRHNRYTKPTVNLGALYSSARAIADSPQFARSNTVAASEQTDAKDIHVALVSLKGAERLKDDVVDGLATTISQLVKLDMSIILVLAPDAVNPHASIIETRNLLNAQCVRLARAIDEHSISGARIVSDAIVQDNHSTEVAYSTLIQDPLKKGIVTIIPAISYDTDFQLQSARLKDIMAALSKDLLATLNNKESFSLDRIILLDPRGGIPSQIRGDGAHIYVNLEQELSDIRLELQEMETDHSHSKENIDGHLENLAIANETLSSLPPSSSVLIVTPEEAAESSSRRHNAHVGPATRKTKNALIHNLLTNKPNVSSSLPLTRFATKTSHNAGALPMNRATLVKKGMTLNIIPAISRSAQGWTVPHDGMTKLDLRTDPRVDLHKLVHLINDSFRRELDVDRYLERIAGRVAGLIIAGDYEGGAILTWEQNPFGQQKYTNRVVPYLDKFAVLQSSQGSAGVADIVFQAMVRTCLPSGVCWRSRSNNPANKWYFERAAGTWQIPDTQWTMFWTGEDVVEDVERWNDYVAVCKNIKPTWIDGKATE